MGHDCRGAGSSIHQGQLAVRSHEIDGMAPQARPTPSPNAMQRHPESVRDDALLVWRLTWHAEAARRGRQNRD
jgi:hypothetical protein